MDFESLYTDLFSGAESFFSGIADIFTDAPVETEQKPVMPEIVAEPMQETQAPQADLGNMIKTEFDKGEASFLDWLSKRPDSEKMQIGLFLAKGAKGALEASAQKDMLDQRNREINQSREDKIRRGSVSRMPQGTFSPKPVSGGLIESGMGG